MNKVRVLVADGQNLFREGVCALLKIREDIEIVGEATNGQEAILKVREQTPDVVLIDMVMPIMDGTEVTRCIHKENSDIKVLLLTQYEDRDRILSGLKAGANGYIPKRAAGSDLVSAILAVYQGGYFLYPSVAKTMVNDYLQIIRHPGSPDPYARLSHREKEVLKLVAEGRKSGEIANLLHIGPKTAQRHRTNLMKKLGIHNRTELIKYAVRKHLIEMEGRQEGSEKRKTQRE
ncbi:response regulator [Chloroflexota bacterium]